MSLTVRPVELADLNRFVALHHRHHKPVQGHRFSLCAVKNGRIVGVASVGRPVARMTCPRSVVEVTRLCTDGTRNACSILYAAAARAAKEIGYTRIQTFILDEEPGVTLRAAGWRLDGVSAGGDGWYSRDGRRDDQPTNPKQRWVKDLNEASELPKILPTNEQARLQFTERLNNMVTLNRSR